MKWAEQYEGLCVTLCESYSERVDIHVRATIHNGELLVSGQDLGPFVEEFFCDMDYEYWYMFDKEHTEALLTLLARNGDPLAELCRRFSGENGCANLRQFCKQNGIVYGFNSYA